MNLATNLNQSSLGHDEFSNHQREFLSCMGPIKRFLPYEDVCFNPYPVVVPAMLSQQLQQLAELLIKSLGFIATHYIDSHQMRSKMPLPKRFFPLLEAAKAQPYKMGTIRPDIIFGDAGSIKVCEVNARFPLNGMTISQQLNTATQGASYLSWEGYNPYEQSQAICSRILSRFPLDQTLVRVSKSEVGGESQYFLNEFNNLDGKYLQAQPEQLILDAGSVNFDNLSVNNFVLEIDREELFNFDQETITHIIKSCNYINDVRTLILIHDKRVLSLVNDPDIMRPFLKDDEHAFVQSYLLQGRELSDPAELSQVSSNKEQWVLKRKSGGRGIDLLVGATASHGQWGHVINELRDDFTAQEYVPALSIPITHFPDEAVIKKMYLVGSLPCFDAEQFGVGVFRASEHPCVNIGNGDGRAIFLASVEGSTCSLPYRNELEQFNEQPFQART